ncbi:hypothetical protein AWH62_00805 [Maricaulis sp. W15]|uniref:hypothetical protein n=1 Tax=Maricaulis sp. W15 TaxID=1772333 RepID=UPI0009490C6E|nr:hypothetical protein [Maricaulis sp. W15]OLF81246.1 hypothetical protein AWH62_00805 [Maricaulis sp. W15]
MTRSEKAKQVRARLRAAGVQIKEVALELGVESSLVYGVLSGRLKGARGDSRRVAVRLGLVEERPLAERMSEALGRA